MSDDAVRTNAVFFLLFLLLLVLFSTMARAQPAFQVADLNTTRSAGIHPEFTSFFQENFAALEGTVFFAASDGIQGTELWRTDGTEAGTRLVADICPGSCASVPHSFMVAGGEVFFLADDGLHGDALWKSDGTLAGTVLVRDVTPEGELGLIHHLSGVEDLVLLSVARINGNELWRSDGTAAGTFPVASFGPGFDRVPEPLARLGGKLLFVADESNSGREPWISDGTAAGTFLLKDLFPGSSDGLPGNLWKNAAVAGGKVFFGALSGLWVSDGTAAGTALVKGIFPRELIVLGGEVFFFASDGSISGLWKSDGTEAGTRPVKPLPSGAQLLTTAGGRLFFLTGCELWTSDGTEAGTVLVEAIPSPPVPGCYLSPSLTDGAEGGGKLLFFASDSSHGLELWASDGTPAGTDLVADLYLGPSPSVSEARRGLFTGGRWYFRAKSGEDVGEQLWTSDGTAAGTRMLRIHHQQSGLLVNRQGKLDGPRAFLDLNGTLLFQGDDGATGAEPWRSDGTAAGTSLVKDLRPGLTSSLPGELTRAGDTVFFRSDAGTRQEKLWRTDGTPEGTLVLFAPSHPPDGPVPFSPRDLTALGDELLFIGSGLGGYSDDLVKSDGTPEGTGLVVAPPGTPYPSYVDSIVSLGDKVLFQAEGTQLWVSDGSSTGTKPLGTILPGDRLLSESSTVWNGVLYFAGFTSAGGEELWRSDGTEAGTYVPGYTVLRPPGTERLGPFASTGSAVFFASSGDELWMHGDAEVTGLVRALPGNPEIGIRSLTALGNKVYFSYDDGVHGRELWVSDGTEAGTRMVEDLLPGPGSSHPRDLHVEGNVLLFSASDGVHGHEPWRSKGAALGTRMLHDIAPGALPSSPAEFTASGPNVCFAANDGTTGFELWALPKPALLSTFSDVPAGHWSWPFAEAVAASRLTSGCGQDNYCPEQLVTRAVAAAFLIKASRGPDFVPPPATGTVFQDAPVGYWASPWIEQLAADGVTAGCGNGNFCSEAFLTRAEAAGLLLRARYGGGFMPPPATGTVFNDVPAGHWAARWIEQLAAEGATSGCGGGSYCPDRPVSRAEMAAFLTKLFQLPLP